MLMKYVAGYPEGQARQSDQRLAIARQRRNRDEKSQQVKEAKVANIMLVKGVEGLCLYINDYRVAGPKPWGGGKNLKVWDVEDAEIEKALERKVHNPQKRHI